MDLSPPDRPLDAIRFDGGRPCLDFVNTIHDRTAEVPEDYLSTPDRYLGWCGRAGLLEERQATRLRADRRALAQARQLREALHAIFAARIEKAVVPRAAATLLDRWLHRAWAAQRFDPRQPKLLALRSASAGALIPLALVALDALELLRSGDPRRLRRCASRRGCGWLFYDESRAGRRRWCSMDTCGALDKVRRYRREAREAPTQSTAVRPVGPRRGPSQDRNLP